MVTTAEIIGNIHEALLQHTAGIPIDNKVYKDASELILSLEANLATLRKAYRSLPRQKKKTKLINESKKDISKFNTTESLESIPPALYHYEDNYYIHLFDGIIIKLCTLSFGYSKEICIYQRINNKYQ